jgi:hypothetical protein
MKIITIATFLATLFCIISNPAPLSVEAIKNNHTADAQWAVVGAGPAGIIVVGVLLDLGTDPKNIIWIDPEFNVGRMGKYYAHVPGNAKTQELIDFINCCKTFAGCSSAALAKLQAINPELECPLSVIVEPLIDICNYLCGYVTCKKESLQSLSFENDLWKVTTDSTSFKATRVVLATGSHPKRLDYPVKEEIPLDLALDKATLKQKVTNDDTIAVIGSAQSAILLLKNLCEICKGRVINFYKHPVDFDNPESGLKGSTADWARDILLKTPPVNLLRIFSSHESLQAWLPVCTKIIYAIGFERNQLPPIHNAPALNYEDNQGIIGPRLFGIGIAFPEKYFDEQGTLMNRIGLISFMEYAQQILPWWMVTKEPLTRFKDLDGLLRIQLL